MSYLFIIASVGFFLWIVRNTLFWVELWQSKEYRLDRLSVHLRETLQGRKLIYSPISVLKWVLLLNGIIIGFSHFSSLYILAVVILYVCEGLRVIYEFFNGYKLRRPVKTIKALTICGLSLITLSIVFICLNFSLHVKIDAETYARLLLLDRAVILVIAFFVLLFALPTRIYIQWKIQKAKAYIRQQKKLLVIAVSGSYGKSSTKEFIAQVLSQKYTVVKTLGSNNTPIGIANTILGRITDETDIFVVEMGAYKKGEVAELCDIVPPNISITTSISDQHLSLFGSLKNAIDTEKELIDALPSDGFALFNGNNENTQRLYEKTKKQKVLYKVVSEKEKDSAITASHVVQKKDVLSFTVTLDKKESNFTTPLLGVHMVENILPAIFIAHHLRIPFADIQQAVGKLTPPAKTMSRKVLENGVTLVDDTFNASPESVKAAISYMQTYEKKKILILMPLVELGKHAKERHYEIGKEVSHTCDYLFVTNKNFYKEIKKGIESEKGGCKLEYKKVPALVETIISLAKQDDIVVFEGKEAGKVLQSLV